MVIQADVRHSSFFGAPRAAEYFGSPRGALNPLPLAWPRQIEFAVGSPAIAARGPC